MGIRNSMVFSPKELLSFIYPYFFGLQNTSDLEKGAYWGFMPFTQSTHYVGLVILIFSILGITLRKPKKFELIFWVITGLIVLLDLDLFFYFI